MFSSFRKGFIVFFFPFAAQVTFLLGGFERMNISGITWRGESIDDVEILRELPPSLVRILSDTNGFILHDGALHVRGAIWDVGDILTFDKGGGLDLQTSHN